MDALKHRDFLLLLTIFYFSIISCQTDFQGPNRPPIAVAGSDQLVEQGEEVRLNGGRSYDPDGNNLLYIWNFVLKPTGSEAKILSNRERALFNADLKGKYLIGLVVQDTQNVTSEMDVVIIKVKESICNSNIDCDDGEDCTRDRCVDGYCEHKELKNGSGCDDGLYCTVDDNCSDGYCNGIKRTCDVLTDSCNQGLCNEKEQECQSQPLADGTACDDGLFCTVNERCQAGKCKGGQPRDCSESSQSCMVGVCDENEDRCLGSPLPAKTPCDDGKFCTVDDVCNSNGMCVGKQRLCDHLDGSCTNGSCDEIGRICVVVSVNEGEACDDGDVCSNPDFCYHGICTGQFVDSDLDSVCDYFDKCNGNDESGDTDADGSCDDIDDDDDGDGWTDLVEIACVTDPWLASSTPQDDDEDGICNPLDQCEGDDASGDYDDDGFCNDIDPPTWEVRCNIPYAAGGAASALLSDGLHFLGGTSNRDLSECYQFHYLYDPMTDSWSSSPKDIPDTDTCFAQAQVYENFLYLVGGYPGGRSLRVYLPVQNSWAELDDIPERFESGFVSAVVGQFLYVIGGEPQEKDNASVYKFDLLKQNWSSCAPIPKNHGHGSLAGTAVGNTIYVINGDKDGGRTLLQIYDTLTDSWTTGEDLEGHFEGATAVAIDNKVYFFGGAKNHDTDISVDTTTEVMIYTTDENSWLSGVDMPTDRFFSTAQHMGLWIHVLGGFDETGSALPVHEVIFN